MDENNYLGGRGMGMKKLKKYRITIIGLCLLLLVGCYYGSGINTGLTSTEGGTLLGALYGAGIGAAIGSTSGHVGEGAGIGALAGSIVGGTIGYAIEKNNKDQSYNDPYYRKGSNPSTYYGNDPYYQNPAPYGYQDEYYYGDYSDPYYVPPRETPPVYSENNYYQEQKRSTMSPGYWGQ